MNKKLKKAAVFLGCALIVGLASCNKDGEGQEPDISKDSRLENIDQQQLLDLVNDWRSKGCNCGGTQMPSVSALTWDDRLQEAAERHSVDMLDNDDLTHTGSDGSSIGDRVTATGYSWRSVAENVAWNYPDEEAVIQGWIESSGHCKNIMSANVTEMGVAKAGAYWTQVFAAE